ncbi:nicotinate-nucleotide--dimethylbenzimidazole phosphoribosyltransferase [Secundilactobacillus paracollinoides]|uniref:nicotinate-nucleotide--dimethylbenzimidazole phosphoribosyltransferase n=1 Tax=Secundilactobacillus paracollinoides TaxID=240427 RepID=UPI00081A3C3A|nr:nicotinate-nucleotide--dimethylbenzimidazole phosphoribosyltransferase [Secundilactobacillus paracollinoides]ANZ65170.1 nicotinate-nucleotide--dimethylbenzimidazole phosphoribosyltransferase [Secundilactobacillus paracollinoides]
MQTMKPHLGGISQECRDAMQTKINGLAKPVGGLGKLEAMAVRIAGIEQTTNLRTKHRCCLVFAADHGVERAGVSATPRKVTWQQAINTLAGHTTVAALAKANNCDVKVIDVGVDYDLSGTGVIDKKIVMGTKNMVNEPAMTRDEAVQSICAGYNVAQQAIAAGNDLLLVGELGMGNTTPASAIISVILGVPAEEVVGRGSIISDKRLAHKTAVVNQAIRDWQPDATDAVDVLAKVGGFEIGAKVGAMICAAENKTPLILDGFISYSAAVLAERLIPGITDYLVASHFSREIGSQKALNWLGLTPLLDLNMAVGEGSGAVISLGLIDSMQSILENMNTLAELDIRYVK